MSYCCNMCKHGYSNAHDNYDEDVFKVCVKIIRDDEDEVLEEISNEIQQSTSVVLPPALQVVLPYLDTPKIISTKGWWMPLHWAVMKNNNLPMVKQLIQAGHRVDVQDIELGRTPLMDDAADGCDVVLELLLDNVDYIDNVVNMGCDNCKRTALHYAALYGHKRCYELLVWHGAVELCVDEYGKTPLQYKTW